MTTIYSTTGTAPLRIVPLKVNSHAVWIQDGSGSGNVYRIADVLAALGREQEDD